MFMVFLCRTCHDCNRCDTLFSIHLEVQELSSLAIETYKNKMHIIPEFKITYFSDGSFFFFFFSFFNIWGESVRHLKQIFPGFTNQGLIPEDLL